MLWAQHPLTGLQRTPVQRLGFLKPPLASVQQSQVVQRTEGVGMLWAQQPLAGLQRTPEQRLGFLIPPLPSVQRREVVQRRDGVGMLGSKMLLGELNGPLGRL